MENTKFIEIKKYKGYKKIGNDLDYIVIINHEEKTVILQFEESTTKTDWKNYFMNEFENLMNKSDAACLTAIKFAKKGDWLMARFWKNASIGYKEKALKLF